MPGGRGGAAGWLWRCGWVSGGAGRVARAVRSGRGALGGRCTLRPAVRASRRRFEPRNRCRTRRAAWLDVGSVVRCRVALGRAAWAAWCGAVRCGAAGRCAGGADCRRTTQVRSRRAMTGFGRTLVVRPRGTPCGARATAPRVGRCAPVRGARCSARGAAGSADGGRGEVRRARRTTEPTWNQASGVVRCRIRGSKAGERRGSASEAWFDAWRAVPAGRGLSRRCGGASGRRR